MCFRKAILENFPKMTENTCAGVRFTKTEDLYLCQVKATFHLLWIYKSGAVRQQVVMKAF